MYKNVFFFHTINTIGGVETMFWELAKKYHKTHDITVYYIKADEMQLKRLKRYVRCIKYVSGEVECERAFFNYNLEPFLSHVRAKHIYEIIHADFLLQRNIKPHIDPRIETYLAVSQRVADSFFELTGVKCELCPNPLTLEEMANPPLFICGAQRLTSEKGGHRIVELIKRLDNDKEIKYYFLLFTNETKKPIDSPNLVFMKPRLDIRPFIYGCDLFVAVSDSEGRCYSVGEKLGYGTGKLLITPCPSFYEQGADMNNSITLDFDMKNMDSVIEEIRAIYRAKTIDGSFKPIKNVDWWDKFLAKGKPTYEGMKYYRVKATSVYKDKNVYDVQLGYVPKAGEEYVIDGERLDKLANFPQGCLVEVIEEVNGGT